MDECSGQERPQRTQYCAPSQGRGARARGLPPQATAGNFAPGKSLSSAHLTYVVQFEILIILYEWRSCIGIKRIAERVVEKEEKSCLCGSCGHGGWLEVPRWDVKKYSVYVYVPHPSLHLSPSTVMSVKSSNPHFPRFWRELAPRNQRGGRGCKKMGNLTCLDSSQLGLLDRPCVRSN